MIPFPSLCLSRLLTFEADVIGYVTATNGNERSDRRGILPDWPEIDITDRQHSHLRICAVSDPILTALQKQRVTTELT